MGKGSKYIWWVCHPANWLFSELAFGKLVHYRLQESWDKASGARQWGRRETWCYISLGISRARLTRQSPDEGCWPSLLCLSDFLGMSWWHQVSKELDLEIPQVSSHVTLMYCTGLTSARQISQFWKGPISAAPEAQRVANCKIFYILLWPCFSSRQSPASV